VFDDTVEGGSDSLGRFVQLQEVIAAFPAIFQSVGGSLDGIEEGSADFADAMVRARGELLNLDVGQLAALREAVLELRDDTEDPVLANALDKFLADIEDAIPAILRLQAVQDEVEASADRTFGTLQKQVAFQVAAAANSLQRPIRTAEEAEAAFRELGLTLNDEIIEVFSDILPSSVESAARAFTSLERVLDAFGITLTGNSDDVNALDVALGEAQANLRNLDAEGLIGLRDALIGLRDDNTDPLLEGVFDPMIADLSEGIRLYGQLDELLQNGPFRSAVPEDGEENIIAQLNALQIDNGGAFRDVQQAITAWLSSGRELNGEIIRTILGTVGRLDVDDLVAKFAVGLDALVVNVGEASREGRSRQLQAEREEARRLNEELEATKALFTESAESDVLAGSFLQLRRAVAATDEAFGDLIGKQALAGLHTTDLSGRFAALQGGLGDLDAEELLDVRNSLGSLFQAAQGTPFAGFLTPLIEGLNLAIQRAALLLGTMGEMELNPLDTPEGQFVATLHGLQAGIQAPITSFEQALQEADLAGILTAEFIAGAESFFGRIKDRAKERTEREEREQEEAARALIESQNEATRQLGLAFDAGGQVFDTVAELVNGGSLLDPEEQVQSLIGGVGGAFSSILGIFNPLAGFIAGQLVGVIQSFVGALQAITDPNGPATRAFRDSVFNGITSGFTSAFTEFVNGDLTTEELEEKLYEAVRGSITSAILDSLIQSALIEGALRPLLEKLGRAVVEGRTSDINGIVGEIIRTVRAAVPALIQVAEQIKAGFSGIPGFDTGDTEDPTPTLFALPEATTLGLEEGATAITTFASNVPLFTNAMTKFGDKVDRLVEDGILIQLTGQDGSARGFTPEEIRA
jgi:hypothetical protein